MGRTQLTLVAPALLVMTFAGVGVAQDDAAKAAMLSRQAEDLLAQGKVAPACSKLDESYALDARGSTALDLAICREREGKIGRAYRMYGEAAELGKKERRNDRVATAKSARNKLFISVPKLTIKLPKEKPAGLLVTVNGEGVPNNAYGKAWEVDPGKLVVQASAPGRKKWETTLTIAKRGRKTVTVPQLAIDDSPVVAPVTKPIPGPTAPKPGQPTEYTPPEPGDEPPGAARTEHADNRLVVDVGAFGGLLFHDIERGAVSELVGQTYFFNSSAAGTLTAECGDPETIPGAGDCEATFNATFGAMVGGQVFVGWALLEQFHLGARGFFAPRFPEGFYITGGPAFSVRAIGPFWIGAGFLFGVSSHMAELASAEGSVPPESQNLNDGPVVDIPLDTLDFTDGTVGSGLLLGGYLELSLSLFGPSPHAYANTGDPGWSFLSGSVMASLWPAITFTQDGFALAIPAGISYRFH